jgi:hypothetical protein
MAFGSSCATSPPKSTTANVPAMSPAPAVAPVSGTDLDQTNTDKIRVGETLKSYPVGHYVDPNDPNVMHEAHVVYRKEAGSSWNLNPNAPTVVPLGPVLVVAEPAKTPSPLPVELEQKMAKQNQLVASLIEQNEALTKELAKIGNEIADLRQKQARPTTEDKK